MPYHQGFSGAMLDHCLQNHASSGRGELHAETNRLQVQRRFLMVSSEFPMPCKPTVGVFRVILLCHSGYLSVLLSALPFTGGRIHRHGDNRVYATWIRGKSIV